MNRRLILIAVLGAVMAVPALAVNAFDQSAMMDPGIVNREAVRGVPFQTTDTIPPPPKPSATMTCNSITYRAHDPLPVGRCFRAITAERGWSPARIDSWFPFIVSEMDSGVISKESDFCWNIRRGEVVPAGEVCNDANKERYLSRLGEDTGFGQATSSLWGRGGILCVDHGVCSSAQILVSPYTSMLYSIVIPVERNGSQPWCFAGWAIDYHDCWEAPDR